MKKIILLPFAILAVFCAPKQTTKTSVDRTAFICPTDGTCSVELFTDKKLELKTDSYGGNYYQILDNTGTTVVHYQYNRKTDPQLADASYREEVLFEINAEKPALTLEDAELASVKAVYGRYCYCRGQTGLYPIKQGTLSVTKIEGKVQYKMQFKIDDVPQIIQGFEYLGK